MHRFVANELILDLTLKPQGPLLIKAGEQKGSTDPSLPDMCFVRTLHRFGDAEPVPTVYLPGSSLKGPVRAYCERVGLTKQVEAGGGQFSWRLACVSVSSKNEGDPEFPYCGKQFTDQGEGHDEGDARERYRGSCMTCQIFGNTALAAHISIDDAYPTDPSAVVTDTRTGVAIDRVLGSVAVGPFDMEVVVDGAFQFSLRLWNFSWAHLGLLSLAIDAFNSEELLLGSGKSRGLGRVAVEIEHMKLRASPPLVDGQNCVGDITVKKNGEHVYGAYLSEPLKNAGVESWVVGREHMTRAHLRWEISGDKELWDSLRSHAQQQFQRVAGALGG